MESVRGRGGMVVAPHDLAAEAGREVLREGGTAAEATVAAAAAVAVLYPHMNGLGGDGVWLLAEPGRPPVAIDACGPAAATATRRHYVAAGYNAIPQRGPLAALTVPGTVAGWGTALAAMPGARPLPLARLLAPAVAHAREGVAVTRGEAKLIASRHADLIGQPGFARAFLDNGAAPSAGALRFNTILADTLERLGRAGTRDLYRGELAAALARDLEAMGSPLRTSDLAGYRPWTGEPLTLETSAGQLFNTPPPTQGLASLLILGLFDRAGVRAAEGFDHVHTLVEATKAAFRVRDAHVTDPCRMRVSPTRFLAPDWLDRVASKLPRDHASPWPSGGGPGDTVWLGAVDADGRAVSFLQSLYWEFGAGVVSPSTGLLLNNRGTSFSLDPRALNALEPGYRPFHTLNPALARLDDGRTLVYGTMGGEGQPQTQAAVFTRHVHFGQPLGAAVAAPRWLLGRTWGEASPGLKLECRFPEPLVAALRAAGHDVTVIEAFSDATGHAGAIAARPDGGLEGASDPRSDGGVAAVGRTHPA